MTSNRAVAAHCGVAPSPPLCHPLLAPALCAAMGASESKYEEPMPPLSAMPPIGVLGAFTVHSQQVRLEFGKKSSGKSDVVDLATGKPLFVVHKRSEKTQVCSAPGQAAVGHSGVLLNVYARTLTSKWEIKGDNAVGPGGEKHKPHLFDVKCSHTLSSAQFRVRFVMHGQQIEWTFKKDKVRRLHVPHSGLPCPLTPHPHPAHEQARRSIVFTNAQGIILAHAGLQAQKSFAGSSRFVLTVAPGVDLAMMVGLCVCWFSEKSQSGEEDEDWIDFVVSAVTG